MLNKIPQTITPAYCNRFELSEEKKGLKIATSVFMITGLFEVFKDFLWGSKLHVTSKDKRNFKNSYRNT